MDYNASDGDRQHSPNTTNPDAAHNEQRTVWPIDDLTRDTEDAIVSGELVATNPDANTVVIETVGECDEHVTVDLSRSDIRKYLFENEPGFIHLMGIETVVFDMFLRVYGTPETTASVFEPVGPGAERTIVPDAGSDGRGFDVVVA